MHLVWLGPCRTAQLDEHGVQAGECEGVVRAAVGEAVATCRACGAVHDALDRRRWLLEAAAEVLRLEWGAIYLADEPQGPLRLVACLGPTPEIQALGSDNPLVERLRRSPAMRVQHALALATDSRFVAARASVLEFLHHRHTAPGLAAA